MSALKRKLVDAFMGHPQPSRGWAAVERLVRERERAAAEKAYDEGVSDFMQAHDSDNFEPWMYLRDNPYSQKDS